MWLLIFWKKPVRFVYCKIIPFSNFACLEILQNHMYMHVKGKLKKQKQSIFKSWILHRACSHFSYRILKSTPVWTPYWQFRWSCRFRIFIINSTGVYVHFEFSSSNINPSYSSIQKQCSKSSHPSPVVTCFFAINVIFPHAF